MASRIPPHLEPYLAAPEAGSLTLLTGVLGASTNWLLLRYIYSFLRPNGRSGGHGPLPDPTVSLAGDGTAGVLLVSFLRDLTFWSEGASRLGLNLDALGTSGKFVFVDGLSELFSSGTTQESVAKTARAWTKTLTGCALDGVQKLLHAAVDELAARCESVVLLLDQSDLLLAAAGDQVTLKGLQDLILDLREKVQSTVITLSADEPLISAQETTLEREHAAFVLSTAHQAVTIMSLRLLDTGTAKDVSGVIRITGGGGSGAGDLSLEEKEFLYFVVGDGSVKVFDRGQ